MERNEVVFLAVGKYDRVRRGKVADTDTSVFVFVRRFAREHICTRAST